MKTAEKGREWPSDQMALNSLYPPCLLTSNLSFIPGVIIFLALLIKIPFKKYIYSPHQLAFLALSILPPNQVYKRALAGKIPYRNIASTMGALAEGLEQTVASRFDWWRVWEFIWSGVWWVLLLMEDSSHACIYPFWECLPCSAFFPVFVAIVIAVVFILPIFSSWGRFRQSPDRPAYRSNTN